MRGLNRYRKLIIVVALVICAMFSRMLARYDMVTGPLNMGVSILRSGIYIGLIIAWGVSIRKRVLYSSVRCYLLAIDGLLLFWMFLRTCKYLFLEGLDPARAFCWYAFYIPMLCIPLMAIFVAQCLGEVEYYTVPKIFRLLYLPNIFLILMVMTNHYHFYVFDFIGGIAGADMPYRYRTGYFLVVVWMTVEIIVFILLLLKKSHVPEKHKRIIAPIIPIWAGFFYTIGYILRVPVLYEVAGDMTAVYSLLIMSVCELCIENGLIPANEFYEELFRASVIGAQIIDEQDNICYSSDSARSFDKKTMKMAKEQPVDLGKEWLLAARVHGGYVLWLDDISKIKELLHHLEDMGKELSRKNEILKAEISLEEKKVQAKEQARLYDKIAIEVKPQLDYLEELIELIEKKISVNCDVYSAENIFEAHPGENIIEMLARICVISSYIKRLGNLILLGEDANYLPAQELEYCIRESVENIRLCNVMVSFESHCEVMLSKDDMLKIYMAFEVVIETTMPSLKALLINLNSRNEETSLKIGIACDSVQWRACKEKILNEDFAGQNFVNQISEEEEDYRITFLCKGEVQV